MALLTLPIKLACTDCHRDMLIKRLFQRTSSHDQMVLAAECDCGRVFCEVDALLVRQLSASRAPLVAWGLHFDAQLGTLARDRVILLKSRIAELEDWITVATWARERPKTPR